MNYYNEQDGLKYVLQQRSNGDSPLGNARRELPRNAQDFVERFYNVETYMNREWHPQVNLGAAVAGDGLLTDHGVQHVQDVIRHAYDIIADISQLTGFEIYILLLSIHFHDVGNISGREEHEQKIGDILNQMQGILPLSTPEKGFICDIATAHGGYFKGDKDTIRGILSDDIFDSIQIRPKVLAAILRFSDEISDDLGRSISNVDIPLENEAYHIYSSTLEPISVEGDTLRFHYRIPFEFTQKKVQKGNQKLYLYDEIRNRLAKCMRELEYCKKYAGEILKLSSASVVIDILQKKDTFRPIKDASESFKLTLQGYPDEKASTFEAYLEKNDAGMGQSGSCRYEDGKDLKKKLAEKETLSKEENQ